MNWGHWVARNQWDAACRSLLQCNPAFGIGVADIADGGRHGFVNGWNKVVHLGQRPPSYVFIGQDHGRTTSVAPDPAEGPVHEVVRRPPELNRSRLWQALLHSGSALVQHGGETAERVQRVHQQIQQAATAGSDEAWGAEIVRHGVADIHAAWHARPGGAPTGIEAFESPVLQCVEAFMDFDCDGDVASGVMGHLLFALCALPRLAMGPAGHASPFVDAVEHLVGVVSELLEQRAAMNTPAYLRASYLAALYGGAALVLVTLTRQAIRGVDAKGARVPWTDAQHARAGFRPWGQGDEVRLERLALNMDEMLAHRVSPCFVLPALFTPFSLLQRLDGMAAAGQRSAAAWAEFYQLDPALRAMLAETAPRQAARPHQASAERQLQLSAALQDFDMADALRGPYHPLSRSMRIDLTHSLLARRFPAA